MIPAWLDVVRHRDKVAIDPNRCAKGSVWELTFESGKCVKGRYHPAL